MPYSGVYVSHTQGFLNMEIEDGPENNPSKPRSYYTNLSQQNPTSRRRGIKQTTLTMRLRYSVAGPSTTCMRTRMRSETYQELIYPLQSHMRSGTPNYCWHGG